MIGNATIEGLSGDWAKAELDGDAVSLRELLADDFIAIGPRGFMLTKEEWIERHQSGKLTYESFALDEMKIRTYGDAAVLTARQVADAIYRDGERRFEMHDDLRMTLILARIAGRNSIVGVQLSPIAGPPS